MNDLLILGSAEPGEALETMVELCLWAIYCTFMKICNIFRLYLVHSTYNRFLRTRAKIYGKNIKPTVYARCTYKIEKVSVYEISNHSEVGDENENPTIVGSYT
jgi:hypothetical protein